MDDMNAFERQVARDALRDAGPSRPVDAAAIFARSVPASGSLGRRFQSLFGATRLAFAAAVVALFGAVLFLGLVANREDESQLLQPGASPTAETEPTDVPAASPEPSMPVSEAKSTVISDLVPGVERVAEEVSPGVVRILGDGVNDLSEDIWHVAASSEGDVWVETHTWEEIPETAPMRVGELRTAESRVFRLGDKEAYVLSRYPDLETEPQEVQLTTTLDGAVLAGGQAFSAGTWSRWQGCSGGSGAYSGVSGADGSCVTGSPVPGVALASWGPEVDADGEKVLVEYGYDDLGMENPAGRAVPWRSGDGTIWAFAGTPGLVGSQIAEFDGTSWTRIPTMEPVDDLSVSGEGVIGIAGGPGGTWASHWDPVTQLLHVWHWDGTAWTASGPIETRAGRALTDIFDIETRVGKATTGSYVEAAMARTGPFVSDTGVVWFDGLVRFDGEDFEIFDAPAPASAVEPMIYSATHANDGSLWLTVAEQAINDPSEASSGLYVITPDAEAPTAVPADAALPAVSSTVPDLLPGVALEVEEVSTGIYRVLGDGTYDLRDDTWDVAVTTAGDVWVRSTASKAMAAKASPRTRRGPWTNDTSGSATPQACARGSPRRTRVCLGWWPRRTGSIHRS
jgi:hypothetical protein